MSVRYCGFLVSTVVIIASLLTLEQEARGRKDIFCVAKRNRVRYDLPQVCRRGGGGKRACPRNRVTGFSFCRLAPRCNALKNKKALRILYNGGVLSRDSRYLRARAPIARKKLVRKINALFFKSAGRVTVTFASITGWAEVEKQPDSQGRYPLKVHPDLLNKRSPAMLVSSIGHEMVHLIQYRRKYSISQAGLGIAVTAFRELEASTWESGDTNYTWPIGKNPVWNCMLPAEQREVQNTLKCRALQVRAAIGAVAQRDQIRSGLLSRLGKWLNQNPWTKTYWLPRNANWKTYTRPTAPPPPGCPLAR